MYWKKTQPTGAAQTPGGVGIQFSHCQSRDILCLSRPSINLPSSLPTESLTHARCASEEGDVEAGVLSPAGTPAVVGLEVSGASCAARIALILLSRAWSRSSISLACCSALPGLSATSVLLVHAVDEHERTRPCQDTPVGYIRRWSASASCRGDYLRTCLSQVDILRGRHNDAL